jgi:hypothetical protein
MEVSGQYQAPAALPQGKNHGLHWLGGCVGPRDGLELLENRKIFFLTWIRIPDRPDRSLVAIPTMVRYINTVTFSPQVAKQTLLGGKTSAFSNSDSKLFTVKAMSTLWLE